MLCININKVIEEGTSGDWYYKKWSNGTIELWTKYSKSVAAGATDIDNYINFPVTFASIPFVSTNIVAGGADLYRGHAENGSTSTTQVRLVLINKHSAAVTVELDVYVHGIIATS